MGSAIAGNAYPSRFIGFSIGPESLQMLRLRVFVQYLNTNIFTVI